MRNHAILGFPHGYRRPVAARRTPTGLPGVPSQDVSRYQATTMPPPIYDLDTKDVRASVLTNLALTLAVVATGAGVVLIERIGEWLAP